MTSILRKKSGKPYYPQQALKVFLGIILTKEAKDLYDENFNTPKKEIEDTKR